MSHPTITNGGIPVDGLRKPTTYTLTVGAEVAENLRALAQESGGTIEDVIAKGIALFGMAVDARARGKAFGVADSADKLDVEIVGLGPDSR